jgi:hypothetical protein
MASEGICWLVCAKAEATAHRHKSKNKVITLTGKRYIIISIIKLYGKNITVLIHLQDTKNSPYINEKTQVLPVFFLFMMLKLLVNT